MSGAIEPRSDRLFAGSIPEVYDTWLVPLIFEPYAADLAERVRALQPKRVLELAAGTGVATRSLAAALPATTTLTATDLNQTMLDRATSIGTSRPVEWRQADAQELPFEDGSFDAVVCQFGVMFFPDRPRALAEMRRVLGARGTLIFSTWDRIEENEFADEVTAALATLFPVDPPRFLARTPHGYHDRSAITRDLEAGAFSGQPQIDTVAARSRAASPHIPALAYCQGTPLRNEIEAHDPARLGGATDAAAAAIARRFGMGAVDGKIQALVVTARSA